MSPLPARAAALRGDDYQHIIGLYYALKVIDDPHLDTVSIEDAAGGAFDDVVVRPTAAAMKAGHNVLFTQVKAGVHNNVVIDSAWLTAKRSSRGRSPLQHFYKTWLDLTRAGEPFELQMFSNKNYDHGDALLCLIDQATRSIPAERLNALPPGGAANRQLQEWAVHLDVAIPDLVDFLGAVKFRHGEEENSWAERCSHLLRLVQLDGSDTSVAIAHKVVREWVKAGVGPRTAQAIVQDMAANGLLARDGELLLTVSAIDVVQTPVPPHAAVDIVELYEGDDPFTRRRLRNGSDWQDKVLPRLMRAQGELRSSSQRKIRLVAAMRLPMYFVVGRIFARVGNWTVVTEQRGQQWSTDVDPQDAQLTSNVTEVAGHRRGLAVSISLSTDLSADVESFLADSRAPVGHVLRLGTTGGTGRTSVPGPEWAASWAWKAREEVRATAKRLGANHLHLFMAAPAGIALFLGHEWNLMPSTTLYEHDGADGYEATLTLPG